MYTFRLTTLFVLILLNLSSIIVFQVNGQDLKEIEAGRVSLRNGWKLSPVGKMLPVGDLPLNIAVSPSRKMLAVTNNGQSNQSIHLFDSEKLQLLDSVIIAKRWLGLTFSRDEKYLYASGGNDNWIMQYQIRNKKLVPYDTIIIGKPWPEKISIAGIAVDDNQQILYAVTKENNSLSKGFIPTGWYPTCVRVIKNTIFVTNGKGLSSKSNPYGPSPVSKKEAVARHSDIKNEKVKVQYIGGLFTGTLQAILTPDDKQQSIYSQSVYKNTPYSKEREMISAGEEGNPIPVRVGDLSPIKYVFYIIKENRTYDQVLGDIPEGNGDTSLVLFGESITPNLHALAEQFVLLDNFYVDGEVSADGHNWTMGAYATDYLEKNWPSSYGGRGGFYPGEGEREIANNKNGFLWDFCKRYGVTYRSYGEFISDTFTPNIPALKDHFCPGYSGFNMGIHDTSRFNLWKKDFDTLLATGNVPRLNTLRFGNDHTEGLKIGRPTPKAHVADNDLAV